MSIYKNAIYEDDNIASPLPFYINNVGYTRTERYEGFTNRPNGRKDYQIIYIKSGVGYFKIGNETKAVGSGNIVFYKPREPQIYTYLIKDHTETFWIHFSGTEVSKIISEIGFDTVKILPFSNGSLFVDTANMIFDEIRRKNPCWNIKSVSALINLLIDIKRDNEQPVSVNNNIEIINRIRNSIEENYYTDISNAQYAKSCDMCVSNFLRLFKEVTGTTPQHYKTIQRIKAAEAMLKNSNYSISQISKIVGFTDSLYFSRVFRKINNTSPSEYRALHYKGSQPPPEI